MRKIIFIALSFFSIMSIIIIVSIQVGFSEYFYNKNKANQMINACKVLEEKYLELSENDKSNVLNTDLIVHLIKDGYFPVFTSKNNEIIFTINNFRNFLDKEILAHILGEEYSSASEKIEKLKEWSFTIDEPTYIVQKSEDKQLTYVIVGYVFRTGDRLILATRTDLALKDIRHYNNFLTRISLVILILSLILSHIIARKMNESLSSFTEKVEKMTQMDFQKLEEIKGPPEVRKLRDSFNIMSERLEDTINQLNESNDKLKIELDKKIEIEKVRKQFISDVSHELKTPISIIKSYSEALIDGVGDSAYYKKSINEEANKMEFMANELLELIRVESDDIEYNFEKIDICKLIKNQISRLDSIIKEYKCSINLNCSSQEIFVKADEIKIEQVVKNLIMNAIIHGSETDNIDIKIVQEDDKACVSIFNVSEPISEYDLEHIWDRFYKVDKSRHRGNKGSGLGLPIAKKIIEKHNGYCKAEYIDGGILITFCLKTI